jgi:hypothetical protein
MPRPRGAVIHVRSRCRIRAHEGERWQAAECIVSYADAREHLALVEESFRRDLGLELDGLRRERPDLFCEPHNVARALAMHHCFRPYGWQVQYENWQLLEDADLPRRTPNASGRGWRIWIGDRQA